MGGASREVGESTRHITQKHNELFKQLVTDRYVELFEQILRDLKRPLKIRVQTKGCKGETLKQIVLETDPSANVDKATPDKELRRVKNARLLWLISSPK